jgi:pantoate--beta-alanine ligase
MKIIKKSNQINSILDQYNNTGFVPTMGTLHDGHLSLIKRSKKENSKTVVSIFVNPKQFNKKKDFMNYPKKIKNDIMLCKKYKVNYLFLPSFNEVYGWKSLKFKYPKMTKFMEHKFRKNHFKGVLDVMSKLLSIIKNTKVYMGEKDYQQLHIIRQFCTINRISSKIIPCKTVRSRQGYALSSRNLLLNEKSKKIMSLVYKTILNYKLSNIGKIFNLSFLLKEIKKTGVNKIDYIENVNLKRFFRSKKVNMHSNIFIAYYLDGVRLIDNI